MSKPFLRQIIDEQVAIRPNQNYLTFGDLRYTYAELDQFSNQVANALRELGLKANDRVVVFLPNGPEFVFCWFATIKLNLTIVPLNTQLKGEALRYIIGHAAPHAVITNTNLLKEIQAVAEVLPLGCKVIVHNSKSSAVESLNLESDELFDYERLVAQAPTERPPDVLIKEDDTALIIYTSGTTGHPKGVMHSRRVQTNHPLYYHPELIQTQPDEVAYTFLPLFHVTSMCVTMGSFVGGSQVVLDSEFNVFGFWDRIRRSNAVVFPYLGAVISMLYARPPREDDANNPARWALGAAVSKEIWQNFERRFGVRLIETYGQTEWGSIWTRQQLYRGEGETRVGSAGKAPTRAEVKILDEDGQELPPGQSGQIVMRPAEPGLMMTGYYQQPELNARVFKDGWYYTGDVGELDADGYLYFKGRLKDYIRRRGENLSSFEIERVVNTHPAVLESAAVGVPSSLSEEEVKLCITLKPDAEITPKELYQFCRKNLPRFMVPRYIEILPDMPRTPTQRVRKFLLAERGVSGAWDRKAKDSESI